MRSRASVVGDMKNITNLRDIISAMLLDLEEVDEAGFIIHEWKEALHT